MHARHRRFALALTLPALMTPVAQAQPVLTQIVQDFARDPGWDNYQNRVVGTGMPQRCQDFGWSPTAHAAPASSPGEIGGRLANSRIPAYYAMPLGRSLTFDDALSASGLVALTELGPRGVSYFGFFSGRRHTWRVYSSMAFRLWEEDGSAQVMFDWMSSDWRGRGAETDVLIDPDGRVHTFRFVYDPDARPDPVWHDPLLARHVTDETGNMRPIALQGEEYILQRARQDEPGLTAAGLRQRLLAARDQGLIEYFHRHGQDRWRKIPHPDRNHGGVTLQFDQHIPRVIWLDDEIRRAPVELDRFGLFNVCRYGTGQTVYFSSVTVNGQELDLSQDAHWVGLHNHATWPEPDFHSMNSFGWTQTQWAGGAPGEIGGLLWRVEPEDPGFAMYADGVGTLSLDDPVEFTGQVCFVDGMTDGSMFFGYFSRGEFMQPLDQPDAHEACPPSSMMGITLNDVTADGYYFAPVVRAADCTTVEDSRRHRYLPDRRPCAFSFRYDPVANDGNGRVTYAIAGEEGTFDLAPALRRAGAQFDRFGLATVRQGGNSVELYFDDLAYTVRRDPSVPLPSHAQAITERAYPADSAGRAH
ncbi:MAG: hypothetical protein AB1505_27495 [Candidatus Latescibacterota bacterium]